MSVEEPSFRRCGFLQFYLGLIHAHRENINGLKPPDLSVDVILGNVFAPKFIYGALIT
jgi:hypothetical protein